MKKHIKQIVSCIMAVAVTIAMLGAVENVIERKASVRKNHDFFEQKKDFDVLFLGTSHVINGVYPMELWNDYGIVSYNLAGHSTPIASSYWVLKNALDYTKPEVVVVDCLAIRDGIKVSSEFDYMHILFDAFPFSVNKVRAVNDLLSEDTEHSKLDLLFPFSKYHNRWNQLLAEDFDVVYSSEKGAEFRVNVAEPIVFEKIPSDNIVAGNTVAMEYLGKIIEECNEQDIEVLLTYLPFPAGEEYQQEANRLYQIAEEYGVDYINFLDLGVVNYETDCYDEASHLNPSGARKVTDYLGQYIIDNYDVSDQRNNQEYAGWIADYEEYQLEKNRRLTTEENAYTYMMMLTDKCNDVIFEVTDKVILEDSKLCVMLNNLGIDCDRMAESAYVVIGNAGKEVDYISETALANGAVETGAGKLQKSWYSDNNYQILLDNIVYNDISVEDSSGIHMRTMVIDNRTNELVETLYYMHIADENVEVDTILCRVE